MPPSTSLRSIPRSTPHALPSLRLSSPPSTQNPTNTIPRSYRYALQARPSSAAPRFHHTLHHTTRPTTTRTTTSTTTTPSRHAITPRTLFTASTTSPTIETTWLAKNGQHAKGGAALAARMSPRMQLVAAEEGLAYWNREPHAMPTAEADASGSPVPWNLNLTVYPNGSIGVSPLSSIHASARAAKDNKEKKPRDKIFKSPYAGTPLAPQSSRAEGKDDTAGFVAFLAVLLLPGAFWAGRWVEGDRVAAVKGEEEGRRAVEGLTRKVVGAGQEEGGLGGIAEGGFWERGGEEVRGVEERKGEKGVVLGEEEGTGKSWFWAEGGER